VARGLGQVFDVAELAADVLPDQLRVPLRLEEFDVDDGHPGAADGLYILDRRVLGDLARSFVTSLLHVLGLRPRGTG
jgi:hypothetical protein